MALYPPSMLIGFFDTPDLISAFERIIPERSPFLQMAGRGKRVSDTVTFTTWRNRPASPDMATMRDDIERARQIYEPPEPISFYYQGFKTIIRRTIFEVRSS